MKSRWSIMLLLLISAPFALADDGIGAIELHHSIAQGFAVRSQSSGGNNYYDVTNGYAVVCKWDATEPNTPTFTISNNGSHAILTAQSHNSGISTNKRCCHWITGPIETGKQVHSTASICVSGTGACQDLTLECTGGWENCPVGWGDPNAKVELNYELGY